MTVTAQQVREARQETLAALALCVEQARRRDKLIRDARDLGVGAAEIGRAAGISRQYVYMIIRDRADAP